MSLPTTIAAGSTARKLPIPVPSADHNHTAARAPLDLDLVSQKLIVFLAQRPDRAADAPDAATIARTTVGAPLQHRRVAVVRSDIARPHGATVIARTTQVAANTLPAAQ